jgi:hypothetical protein
MLQRECYEITAVLVSSVQTAKENLARGRQQRRTGMAENRGSELILRRKMKQGTAGHHFCRLLPASYGEKNPLSFMLFVRAKII